MSFGTGLVLGLVIGGAWALLMAPTKGQQMRERLRSALSGEKEQARGNHDPLARLRETLKSVREQAREAWQEAREAAREAEEGMRARYRAAVSRRGRSGASMEQVRRRPRQR